jgi:hypothetical protein
MGVSNKVMEALRAGILLNERVTTLIDKVNRMDQDIRHMNDKLIRLETLVEVAKMQQIQIEKPISPTPQAEKTSP